MLQKGDGNKIVKVELKFFPPFLNLINAIDVYLFADALV